MADRKKLEELFIALVLEDKQLETQYRQVVTRAKEVAKEIQTAIAGSLGAGLVDDGALDAAFQAMQAKAQAAMQAVERAAQAQQREAQSTKAAADTIAQAVDTTTKATEDAARAATSAMSDLGATASKAADAADDLAAATSDSAESGKAFSEWADSMRARLEALRQSVQQERQALEGLDQVQIKLGESGKHLSFTQDELEAVIASLSSQVRTSRNLWASMVTSGQEFQESTRKLRDELVGLVEAGVLTEEQMRKVTQAAAFAQRGLDSAAGVASRGGLAWTAQIALANQFGQQLRNLGPAGQAAAGALGIFQNNLGNLQRPLTSADFQLSKLGSTLLRLPSLLALGTAALTVGMGAALAKLTMDAAKLALELEAMTFRTGMGAEALQELEHAARQTGVQTEILGTTMQRLQRRAADANAGNKQLRESFAALGVTLTDSSGQMLDTMSLLEQVADGLASIDNDAERIRRAFQVFDTEGARLLPLLSRGSAGIKALRQEARELGLVISGDAVMSLAELQAKLETVKRQFEVTRVEVAAAFVPMLDRVLVPLLQTRVVPALQNVVTRVTEFSTAFFDQTEAGVAFRKDVVANLQAVIALGRGVVAAANAVAVAVNSIFSVTASIGSYIGNITTLGMDSRTRQGLRESLEQLTELRDRARELGDTAAVERFNSQIAATNKLLGEMGDNWFTGIFRSGDDALNYAEGVLTGFDNMMNAITFDAEALLEKVVSGFDPNSVRSALAPVADVIGGALGDGSRQALEGSLAYAREQLQKAMDDFNFGATDEAREAAWAVVEVWQEAIRLIQLAFGQLDPLHDAKIWTGRLEAEMREGVKSTQEVFMLLTAGIERTREQASLIFDEFGWDSDEYREVIQKLEFLEGEVTRLVGKPKTLEIDVKTNVLPISVLAVMPDFSIPTEAQSGIEALVTAYRNGFLRIADAQAALNGVTLETRDTYQEALEVFEIALTTVQEGSAEYLLLADAIVAVRRRLKELDEELKTPIDLFRLPDFSLPAQEMDAAQAIVDAYMNNILKVVDVQARLSGVTKGTRDAYQEATEIFEAILPTLDEGTASWLAVAEALIVVRQRAAELTAELNRMGAVVLPDFSLPAQDATVAQAIVDAYMGNILKVIDVQAQLNGVTEDTRRAYNEAAEIFEGLLPTLKEGSDDWLLVAQALITVRQRAEEVGAALDSLSGVILPDFSLPAQDMSPAQAIVTAYMDMILKTTDLQARLNGVTLETRDAYQEAAEIFEAILPTLAEGSDEWIAVAEALLAVRDALKEVDEELSGLQALRTGLEIAGQITNGLTSALEGLRDGNLDSVLSGLTNIGAAIGTAIGGPMVGAIVQQVGQIIQALPRLFQAVSDLFTGDSPARRKLRDSLAQTVAGAFRSGIIEGLQGGEDWRANLRQNVQEAVVGALVDAFIQAAVMQAIFAPFIDQFTKILNQSGIGAAFAYFDQEFEGFWNSAMSVIEEFVSRGQQYFKQAEQAAAETDPLRPGVFELPSATVTILAAPTWALELTSAAERMREAGDQMVVAAQMMQATFSQGIPVTQQSTRGVDAARSL